MHKIKQMQLNAILDRGDCNKLIDDLSRDYELLLYGMKKNYIKKLDLNIKDEDSYIKEKLISKGGQLVGGDIIYLKPDTLMYYKVPTDKGIIEAGIIGNTNKKEFEELLKKIKLSVFETVDGDAEWEPVKKLEPSFDLLTNDSRAITPTQDEVKAAVEMINPEIRKLLDMIKSEPAISLEKLTSQIDIENLEDVIKKLQELMLINTDFILLCSKTSQQILKVPDKTALDDISKKGFKCFICGSSISDEKLIRAISCSDFGKKVIDDSYWFLIIAMEALKSIGFKYEEMLVRSDETPDTSVLLNVNGEAMMIHLSNRKLYLEDAYIINAHIAAYKLDHLILMSTEPLSLLMKNHLKEANPDCKIYFIEGLDSIAAKIQNMISENEKVRLYDILKDLTQLTDLPMEDLIMKKVVPDGIIKPKSGLEEILFTEMKKDSSHVPPALSFNSSQVASSLFNKPHLASSKSLPLEISTDKAAKKANMFTTATAEGDIEDEIITGTSDSLKELQES